MDEFTKKMLEQSEDMKIHPERYHLTFNCPRCKGTREVPFPPAEVERAIARYGNRMVETLCPACREAEAEEEEDDE